MMRSVAKWSLLTLAFTPLVIVDTLNSTVFGKVMLIRAALLVTVLATLWLLLDQPRFRAEMRDRARAVRRHPLVLAVLAFMAAATLGTVLAASPSKAFFGDLLRGEGLIGLWCFFGFGALTYLLFSYRDWLTFFKLSLATGAILFINELAQAAGGTARPGSYIGNPEFLAGYFVFVLFCAVVVFNNAKQQAAWRWTAAAAGVMAVIGIFVTQTRGTILALVVGGGALAIYGLVYCRRRRLIGRLTVQTAVLAVTVALLLTGGLIYTTRSAAIWQKIPGVARIVNIVVYQGGSTDSATVNTRLIAARISLKAATHSGLVRGLIGYGQDNFNVAFNRFYDPAFFRYDHGWLDRAHNKLLEVLVMQGLLGLLAYLAIWISLAWLVFWRQPFSANRLAVWLFGAIYFTHLLMVFDQVATYIPLFGVWAFAVSLSAPEAEADQAQTAGGRKARRSKRDAAVKFTGGAVAMGLAAVGLAWVLAVWTLIPLAQMSSYRDLARSLSTLTADQSGDSLDAIFEPDNYCQQDIRTDFVRRTLGYFGSQNAAASDLFLKALARLDETEAADPWKPRYQLVAGLAYDQKWAVTRDPTDLRHAEAYYRQILAEMPLRQDAAYALAANLVYQHRPAEAVTVMRREFAADQLSPETRYYLGYAEMQASEDNYDDAFTKTERAYTIEFFNDPPNGPATYRQFAQHYYASHDAGRLTAALKRLAKISPKDKLAASGMLQTLAAGGWPESGIE